MSFSKIHALMSKTAGANSTVRRKWGDEATISVKLPRVPETLSPEDVIAVARTRAEVKLSTGIGEGKLDDKAVFSGDKAEDTVRWALGLADRKEPEPTDPPAEQTNRVKNGKLEPATK